MIYKIVKIKGSQLGCEIYDFEAWFKANADNQWHLDATCQYKCPYGDGTMFIFTHFEEESSEKRNEFIESWHLFKVKK